MCVPWLRHGPRHGGPRGQVDRVVDAGHGGLRHLPVGQVRLDQLDGRMPHEVVGGAGRQIIHDADDSPARGQGVDDVRSDKARAAGHQVACHPSCFSARDRARGRRPPATRRHDPNRAAVRPRWDGLLPVPLRHDVASADTHQHNQEETTRHAMTGAVALATPIGERAVATGQWRRTARHRFTRRPVAHVSVDHVTHRTLDIRAASLYGRLARGAGRGWRHPRRPRAAIRDLRFDACTR